MTLIREQEMPPTRLELRWRKNDDPEWPQFCEYNLVLELDELDIRGEVYEGNELVERKRAKILSLGGTRAGGRRSYLNLAKQTIGAPFRDGAHARWDSKRLNGLPVYLVCDGWAMRVPQENDE